MTTACAAAAPAPPGAVDSLHVRVLATHDFHGGLRPTVLAWSNERPVGGAPALSAVMDSAEARCRCPTLRLDGGDQMQGSLASNLVHGASVVAAFNLLGLDAAAVGNHELDWGVDTLLARQGEARYAWLAANVFLAANGERPDWATPSAIIEEDGVRVGVIGYLTASTARTLRPDVTRPYLFRAGYAGIREALETVRRARPDFVIVVAHAGGECGEDACTGEVVQLARELPADQVDLIVGGHDHESGEGLVNGVPIVRAGGHGRAVAVIDLFRAGDGRRSFRIARDTVYVDRVAEDREMVALLEPYLSTADSLGRAPVTTLAERLSSAATGDRRLGNLIADASRLLVQADFGMHNPGGVRADLRAGTVSYADLFSVMPFGNEVVLLTISGVGLRRLVEQAGVRYYFSNLLVGYDPEGTPPNRVVSLVRADGAVIEDGRSYSLALPDFLADGGDGLAMLVPLPRVPSGVTLLDAVVVHLRGQEAPVALPVETRAVPVRRD